MPADVEFVFDFGSPNAYLAWKVLPGMLAPLGARVRILPCLLGGIFKATQNQAPMLAFGAVREKLDYERLEMQRFIARHGLDRFRMNPHFPINTLLLMRGLVAAQADGVAEAYLEAGLAGMWEEGLKLDDPAVFTAAMDAAGLDGAALVARTQDAGVKQTLSDNTAAAVERGAFGIPTFFVGDEMFFGKDRLVQVVEAVEGAF